MTYPRGRIARLGLPSMRRWGPLLIAALWAGAPVAGAGGQSAGLSVAVAAEHVGWSTAAPMSTARGYLAAARGPNGTIYAIGGYDTRGRPLRTVAAYNPRTHVWSHR